MDRIAKSMFHLYLKLQSTKTLKARRLANESFHLYLKLQSTKTSFNVFMLSPPVSFIPKITEY